MPASSTILELLAAAGIGGILAQYVGKGSERRAARAEVLQALRVVDTARWNIPTEGDDEFSDQLRALKTSAMIAQVPRRLVDEYGYGAQATRVARMEAHKYDPDSVGLNREFSDYVDEVRDLLVGYLWQPWLARLRLGTRLPALEAKRRELRGDMTGPGRYLGYEYWPV
jgi:hypothetical protein